MTDSVYKLSAVALQNRGLARISRAGGWHATITDAGSQYLERGTQPTPAAANGEASIHPTQSPQFSRTVWVPVRLRKRIHPLVAQLRDGPELNVSGGCVPRALRILQGLVVAVEHEGWRVRPGSPTAFEGRRRRGSHSVLVIDTGEHEEELDIGEEMDRLPHTPTARERHEQEEWSSRMPEWDYHPSGRFFIEIGTHRGRRRRWVDCVDQALEGQLGRLIDEIECRSDFHRQNRLVREVEEERLCIEFEAADSAEAISRREDHRLRALLEQASSWATARLVSDYLAAMESVVDGMRDCRQAEEATEWLDWCRGQLPGLDPLDGSIGMPSDPEADPEEDADWD